MNHDTSPVVASPANTGHVATVEAGKFANRLQWVSDEAMARVPAGTKLYDHPSDGGAAELIAGQRAALDSHYATREQIITLLHAATDGPSRVAAIDTVLQLLAAQPAPPVTLPSEPEAQAALDDLEGYFNRESIGFQKCRVLRSVIAALPSRQEAHDLALEAAIGVCKVQRDWASVDAIRALKNEPLASPVVVPSVHELQVREAARKAAEEMQRACFNIASPYEAQICAINFKFIVDGAVAHALKA